MSATPTIGVLALQGDVREHHRLLRAGGVSTVDVRRPEELLAVDGLVIPGGESTTIGKLAATFELLEPLRKRVAGGMPTFGTCAGMILLADRLRDGAAGPADDRWDRHDGPAQRLRPPGRLVRGGGRVRRTRRPGAGRRARSTRSSSARRGSRRSDRAAASSRASPPVRPSVGSSPFARITCSRRHSTPS